MTPLAVAIETQEWPLVSLYLLLGVSEAASKLPPESLTELLDLLWRRRTRRSARTAVAV